MKIKNSVRTKLLAGLLIGTTLGTTLGCIASTNAFAYSTSSSIEYASKEESDKIINEIKQESKARSSKITYRHYESPCCYVVTVRGNTYAISAFGRAMVGKCDMEGDTYYFDKYTLKAQKGWYNVPGDGRYYFNPNTGIALKNGVHTVNGESFYFNRYGTVNIGLTHAGSRTYFGVNKTGALVSGFYSTGGKRYYFDPSTKEARTGWYQDGSRGIMYFNYDGTMAKGVTRIGSDTYLFLNSGRNENAYRSIGYYSDTTTDKRYYFQPETGKALKSSWLQVGRGYMHFDADGVMAKGVKKIDGKTFVFTKGSGNDWNYYRDTGWYTDQETGNRYYFGGPLGEAVTGIQRIDGRDWSFNREGVLLGVLN